MLLAAANEVVVLCGSRMTGLDAVDRFLLSRLPGQRPLRAV